MALEWIQKHEDDMIYGFLRSYKCMDGERFTYRVNFLNSKDGDEKHYGSLILSGGSCGYIGDGEPCVVEISKDGVLGMLTYNTNGQPIDNGKRYNICHSREYRGGVKDG